MAQDRLLNRPKPAMARKPAENGTRLQGNRAAGTAAAAVKRFHPIENCVPSAK
jgi:hypothetical protein